eukprot:TRINITY_DN1696_c0_g4_i3.p1 TRINITY_DN1696_c0_g4~~TRINITY_DN1696_c0_g4_i3.p1  ORF type:complete len:411 (-),score=83.17 TRINITY_DN1696_c0_g4_i3:264-1496(-)
MLYIDLEKFDISKSYPTVVYLESGTLYFQGCHLCIEYFACIRDRGPLVSMLSKVACLVAKPDTTLKMLDCEIKGHKACLTAGCLFKMANVTMALCKIYNHRIAGVISEGKAGVKVSILSNNFLQNNLASIYLYGPGSHPKVKKNEILETNGIGIYCYYGTMPLIIENMMRKNHIGVFVESADPMIFRNEIKNCFESAVIFTTIEEIGCGGELSMCTIRENEEHGVVIKGKMCNPKIYCNLEISLSKLAGIKVTERARPVISNNLIKNNLGQGILLVEGSSAHILRNDIEGNVKANIAFGGILSGDTIIEQNNIILGRSEGIFMIEGEYAIITQNVIRENMDGILLSTASPLISHNRIIDNKRCGIVMINSCNPRVTHNKIIKNYACGILVRQNSLGLIEKNEVTSRRKGR